MTRLATAFTLLMFATGCKNSNYVLLRNGFGVDVKVTIEGNQFLLASQQTRRVHVPRGDYEVAVMGVGPTDRQTLSGESSVVLNIGGKPDLALVGSTYATAGASVVRPLTSAVTVLDPHELIVDHHVNEPIPKGDKAGKAGFTSYYLCTYEPHAKSIGCPIAP